MAIFSGSLAMTLPDGREASFNEMQVYGNILQYYICK